MLIGRNEGHNFIYESHLNLGDRIRTKAQLMKTVLESKHPEVKIYTILKLSPFLKNRLIIWLKVVERRKKLGLSLNSVNSTRNRHKKLT